MSRPSYLAWKGEDQRTQKTQTYTTDTHTLASSVKQIFSLWACKICTGLLYNVAWQTCFLFVGLVMVHVGGCSWLSCWSVCWPSCWSAWKLSVGLKLECSSQAGPLVIIYTLWSSGFLLIWSSGYNLWTKLGGNRLAIYILGMPIIQMVTLIFFYFVGELLSINVSITRRWLSMKRY